MTIGRLSDWAPGVFEAASAGFRIDVGALSRDTAQVSDGGCRGPHYRVPRLPVS